MEAEIGVIYPQAKEHLEPPEAGESKEGAWPCWHTLISDSGLKNCERKHFSVLSHQICGDLFQQPQEPNKAIYFNLQKGFLTLQQQRVYTVDIQ